MDARRRSKDTVRMIILADGEGTILGAFDHMNSEGVNPPARMEIVPSDGQVLREVEVPLEVLLQEEDEDTFARHRLEFDDESGRLVER